MPSKQLKLTRWLWCKAQKLPKSWETACLSKLRWRLKSMTGIKTSQLTGQSPKTLPTNPFMPFSKISTKSRKTSRPWSCQKLPVNNKILTLQCSKTSMPWKWWDGLNKTLTSNPFKLLRKDSWRLDINSERNRRTAKSPKRWRSKSSNSWKSLKRPGKLPKSQLKEKSRHGLIRTSSNHGCELHINDIIKFWFILYLLFNTT